MRPVYVCAVYRFFKSVGKILTTTSLAPGPFCEVCGHYIVIPIFKFWASNSSFGLQIQVLDQSKLVLYEPIYSSLLPFPFKFSELEFEAQNLNMGFVILKPSEISMHLYLLPSGCTEVTTRCHHGLCN